MLQHCSETAPALGPARASETPCVELCVGCGSMGWGFFCVTIHVPHFGQLGVSMEKCALVANPSVVSCCLPERVVCLTRCVEQICTGKQASKDQSQNEQTRKQESSSSSSSVCVWLRVHQVCFVLLSDLLGTVYSAVRADSRLESDIDCSAFSLM